MDVPKCNQNVNWVMLFKNKSIIFNRNDLQ